ncbi:MAG: hypothetical protein FJ211_09610 [Ignavibacteria bacterium]|nr:hypothetical protein [Ignavibacteria bacterium]
MKIYFGGAEKGMYASMLLSAKVRRIGINLTHLAIPKKRQLDLRTKYENSELLVYTSEGDEDVGRYDAFLRAHADDLTLVIGRPDYDGTWLGEKYVPIWNDADDLERLNWICQRNGRVAISDKALTKHHHNRLNAIAMRWNAEMVGLTSKPDNIENYKWDAVLVNSWTSAVRYGETQVWTGHGLRRYPAQQKDSARKRHRVDIERLGVSYENVAADEVDAVSKLAIVSWKRYEEHIFGGYDTMTSTNQDASDDTESGDIIITPPHGGSLANVENRGTGIVIPPPEKRNENDRLLLPVIGVETITSMGSQTIDEHGESIEIAPEQTNVIRYSGVLLRQCDNCYLASKCPAFKEHAECAFKLPVEIRTKDQLQAALRAMIEMQVSRVMFARFAEELEGQGLDGTLSSEMDRAFDMIEKFKNINDTRDLVRFEVEARGSSGVLSRLFGQRAADQANALPYGGLGPSATDAFYQEVIDVEEEQ